MAKPTKPNHRLKHQRESRGWSQREVADHIGAQPFTVSRWERGGVVPSPYYRAKLCDLFGMNAYALGFVEDELKGAAEHPSHQPPSASHADSSLLTAAESASTEPGSSSPPPPVPGIWNVPYTRNPFFTGRERLLEHLHERLSTTRAAALTQPQALFGLGGIGKTRAAAEYAFRYGADYTHVFWMLAASRESLIADYVMLAQRLDLPEKNEPDQQRIVAAVKDWLATHDGWLLILDNADDLPLAQEFLPTRHKGYVLFTTRAQAAGVIAASVEVEKLSQQAGALLLLRWTKLLDRDAPRDQAQAADRNAALRIVREMDGLPLALVQAGAYMQETGCTLSDYLHLYRTHRTALLARHSRLILDYAHTVATTWSLSFEQIEQQSPAAAELLRLCAFLAPDAIPEELLTRGAAELGVILGPTAADPFKLDQALEVLRRYSLLQRNGDTHTLSIHRLVQVVLKDSMDQQTKRVWAERTVRAANAAFPDADPGTGAQQQDYLQSYLPHVQECATLIKEHEFHFPEAARLLQQAGAFLYAHGFYRQSHAFHRQALSIREKTFGPQHPAVAESLNTLAMLARGQGEDEQAEGLHRRALTIREKTLGPHHPETAVSLNNLGVLYRSQGKYELAEPLLQQVHSIYEQTLGPDHLNTLVTFLNLANLYAKQRRYQQAEQMLQRTLLTSQRVLEPGHPLIAHTLSLLARLSFEQGNTEQAELLWKQSLALFEQTLGPQHPVVAERLNDLAELSEAQGRSAQAQSLCESALSIAEKMLGAQHPVTSAYRAHLAQIMSRKEAEQDGDLYPALPRR